MDNNFNKAPKWVGVIGIILLLSLPLEGTIEEFERGIVFYLLFNLPLSIFCFYVSGGFEWLIKKH